MREDGDPSREPLRGDSMGSHSPSPRSLAHYSFGSLMTPSKNGEHHVGSPLKVPAWY